MIIDKVIALFASFVEWFLSLFGDFEQPTFLDGMGDEAYELGFTLSWLGDWIDITTLILCLGFLAYFYGVMGVVRLMTWVRRGGK